MTTSGITTKLGTAMRIQQQRPDHLALADKQAGAHDGYEHDVFWLTTFDEMTQQRGRGSPRNRVSTFRIVLPSRLLPFSPLAIRENINQKSRVGGRLHHY